MAIASVLVLAAGCGNKNKDDQTQNPDQAAGDAVDGGDAGSDEAATQSRARGSTATRSAGRGTKARQVTAKKPPRLDPIPADAGGEDAGDEEASPFGLLATAYSYEPKKGFPEDMSTLGDPLETFEVPNLDFDEIDFTEGFPGSASLKENYLIAFSGSINVVEEGEYELCLHSDDGSQLLLEGMLVVDNGIVHDGAVEACELLYLAPGEYMLDINYMQGVGPLLTMHFAWAFNGGEKVIVPSEVLFKPDPSAG